MSYIRCLSNPEGLYIWGDTSGNVVISYREFNTPSKTQDMPQNVWYGLFKKFWEYQSDCEYEGAKLQELGTANKFKWRLSYKDWHVDMWKVTLYYIAERVKKEL